MRKIYVGHRSSAEEAARLYANLIGPVQVLHAPYSILHTLHSILLYIHNQQVAKERTEYLNEVAAGPDVEMTEAEAQRLAEAEGLRLVRSRNKAAFECVRPNKGKFHVQV